MVNGIIKIDFSKGVALHRLYGHSVFVIEAEKAKKDAKFIKDVCRNLRCLGVPDAPNWQKHL